MSGHSKWAGIKHKKAKVDAQRGRVFTKIIREITVAARVGGGDPDGNPRLRLAIDKAKAVNMPQDNIQRAIQKGTGELPGTSYEEYIYEGYGPGGVAVLLEIVTDNKNRTAPEIRKAFAKHGGNLGESGCVAWMFEKKGLIQVEASAADEDRLFGVVLEAGAEDVRRSDDTFEVITAPKDLERVKASLAKEKIEIAEGEVTMLPQSTVRLEGKQAQQMLQLMETLEEHDDVQNVYANFDIPEEIMAAVTG
ncbi:MAG: YebC/PmpR family DNA-binding transcriptional regulator [Candidatus Methylomirabilota bacterium]|nr:MAG: YebC/PmpR family DNA-binding transcriptional regulator [candidate division NC10 bacterium]